MHILSLFATRTDVLLTAFHVWWETPVNNVTAISCWIHWQSSDWLLVLGRNREHFTHFLVQRYTAQLNSLPARPGTRTEAKKHSECRHLKKLKGSGKQRDSGQESKKYSIEMSLPVQALICSSWRMGTSKTGTFHTALTIDGTQSGKLWVLLEMDWNLSVHSAT